MTNTVRSEAPLTQGFPLSYFQFCPSTSSLASIGAEVIENANQTIAEDSEFIAASEQLQQNLAEFDTQKQQLEEAEIAASQAPEIERFDLIKLEPEEIGEANNASE